MLKLGTESNLTTQNSLVMLVISAVCRLKIVFLGKFGPEKSTLFMYYLSLNYYLTFLN